MIIQNEIVFEKIHLTAKQESVIVRYEINFISDTRRRSVVSIE